MVKENQTFERLTTKYIIGKTKNRANIWHCKCDCGKEIDVSSVSLSSGNTKSCGCLHKDSMRKMGESNRKLNRYDLSNDYGIGYTTNNTEFYFDLEDYDKIKNYTWYLNDQGYVLTLPFGEQIRIHRLLMNALNEDKYDIDHKDRNPLNNRKSNLRICEHYQNTINSSMYSNNTTGRKGVYWDKNRNKWMAILTINKKNYHLGRFDKFEDAVKTRAEAEEKYHKEFTGEVQ